MYLKYYALVGLFKGELEKKMDSTPPMKENFCKIRMRIHYETNANII